MAQQDCSNCRCINAITQIWIQIYTDRFKHKTNAKLPLQTGLQLRSATKSRQNSIAIVS